MKKSTDTDPSLINDFMKLSTSVFGNLLSARHDVKSQAKQRIQSIAQHLDLVTRREFDVAFAMITKARTMQEELAERLNVIEAKLKLSRTSGSKVYAKSRLPLLRKSNDKRKSR